MKIKFLGGAGQVSGSCYLLENEAGKILIDCGSNQGGNEMERKNQNQFSFDVNTIDALFVTHSHIDHIGRIPQLTKAGYQNKIYSTPPTKDSSYELLLDSFQLMEENRKLYEIKDIDKALSIWEGVKYHQKINIKNFEVEFYNSGHILGSASIKVTSNGKSIVFSGDLGNIPAPLVKDTEYIKDSDYAVIESAYGGRIHESTVERRSLLEDLIEETAQKKGVLMIPAFAMERTQELLYELNDLVENGRIPKVPIFIDSPLAIRLTAIYKKYLNDSDYFDKEAIDKTKGGENIFNFPGLRFTLTTEESKEINGVIPPKVVIAGSGMSNGGRILHHEMRYLPDPNSTILFVGFQAEGSLGRQVIDEVKEVTIFGEKIPVNCRVEAIGGYSAHADQILLLKWVESMKGKLKKVFIVQGEDDQSQPLMSKIKDELAIDSMVPKENDEFELI